MAKGVAGNTCGGTQRMLLLGQLPTTTSSTTCALSYSCLCGCSTDQVNCVAA